MNYAIMTFRDDGPIKTISALRGAEVHNSRQKPIPNAVPGGPRPIHLIGTGNLVKDVRGKLQAVGLDLGRLRKNGVIAYEAVMTASPEFFEAGAEDERGDRLNAWVQAQIDFAVARYGRMRIVSMVLHLDEKTPHIHLIVLPLEVKRDLRRNDDDLHWSLVGRTISGPGQFDKLQDEYAAAMSSFGLARGVRGSGAKHEPPAIFMKRMNEQQRELYDREVSLTEREAALARAIDALVRQRGADMAAMDERKRELDAREADIAAREARVKTIEEEARRAASEITRQALQLRASAMAEIEAAKREKAAAEKDRESAAGQKAENEKLGYKMAEMHADVQVELGSAARERGEAVELHRRLKAGLTGVAKIYAIARDMHERYKDMPIERRPAPAADIMRQAVELEREVAKARVPNPGLDPAIIAQFQAMKQRGAAMG